MILHGSYTSPYVRHCRIVLSQTDLDWTMEDTDYDSSARQSPTMRVPFLTDGDLKLTDSSSILHYICEKTGQPFLRDAAETELYALANTACDAQINLFILKKDGITAEQSNGLRRQEARLQACLTSLNDYALPTQPPYNHAQLRLGCFLAWAQFRALVAVDDYPNLAAFLAQLHTWQPFADTAPPVN